MIGDGSEKKSWRSVEVHDEVAYIIWGVEKGLFYRRVTEGGESRLGWVEKPENATTFGDESKASLFAYEHRKTLGECRLVRCEFQQTIETRYEVIRPWDWSDV